MVDGRLWISLLHYRLLNHSLLTRDTIQDIEIPGSVVKLSNNVLGTFVPSSFAADGDCAFSKYCVFVMKNGIMKQLIKVMLAIAIITII